MTVRREKLRVKEWSRRNFIKVGLAFGGLVFGGTILFKQWERIVGYFSPLRVDSLNSRAFIGKAASYNVDIASIILSGLDELGISPEKIRNKRILLKPNLVETSIGASHINTHPLVVRGTIEAFLKSGAESVIIAEGPGHCRDSLLVLEESGMGEILHEDNIPFVDLNYAPCYTIPNTSSVSSLSALTVPVLLREVDWVVSMAKMKTHHWMGVTLSMKNLFGIMPGMFYGWPKNVLHWAGIGQCIIDINALLRPHLAIVDGIVGMEGDGPIMGTPKPAGVIVMGQNLTSVDATCARIMGIRPEKITYLLAASKDLGPIRESDIPQQGEQIDSVRTEFALLDYIPSQKRLKE
jgi:uncharacterized protein (DUF362 family)